MFWICISTFWFVSSTFGQEQFDARLVNKKLSEQAPVKSSVMTNSVVSLQESDPEQYECMMSARNDLIESFRQREVAQRTLHEITMQKNQEFVARRANDMSSETVDGSVPPMRVTDQILRNNPDRNLSAMNISLDPTLFRVALTNFAIRPKIEPTRITFPLQSKTIQKRVPHNLKTPNKATLSPGMVEGSRSNSLGDSHIIQLRDVQIQGVLR